LPPPRAVGHSPLNLRPSISIAPLARAAVGAVVALVVVLAARRARSLAPSGGAAALLLGTAACAAGWEWAALLILFFGAGTTLSHVGAAAKRARTASVVEKGDERDAAQVLANGGAFGAAALASLVAPSEPALAFGAGALAAAAADTFATEVGTLVGGTPRSLLTHRPVALGMSGGVTWAGTGASLAGAALLALSARALGWSAQVACASFAGGVAGSLVDSLLGAAAQARRRCPQCDRPTERRVHDCGAITVADGGVAWLGNDAVNLASTATGGLLAALLLRLV
jgi:uncharacterized protein (TIGR00297 family)